METPIVYLASAIRGVKVLPEGFLWEIANFMEAYGAIVLSKHVAARNPEEMRQVFLQKSGIDRGAVERPDVVTRQIEMAWIERCTHMVAFVDGASTGVGMEIEHALHRPVSILCLVN